VHSSQATYKQCGNLDQKKMEESKKLLIERASPAIPQAESKAVVLNNAQVGPEVFLSPSVLMLSVAAALGISY
jgi:hypothetical protein